MRKGHGLAVAFWIFLTLALVGFAGCDEEGRKAEGTGDGDAGGDGELSEVEAPEAEADSAWADGHVPGPGDGEGPAPGGDPDGAEEEPEPPCSGTPVPLLEALAGAGAGDVVVAAAGEYAGPVRVPPGVMLCALAGDEVKIVTGEAGTALKVETAAGEETVVENIDVSSAGGVAVMVIGEGSARLRKMTVTSLAGFGLAAEGPDELRLEEVSVGGPVTNPFDVEYPIDPRVFPTIGIAMADIASLRMSGVVVRGFAGFGAVFYKVSGSWQGGGVSETVGVGVLQDGGSLDIRDVAIRKVDNCRTVRCSHYNMVFAYALIGGGVLDSVNFSLVNSKGIGLFQEKATSAHENLRISENRYIGVWLQEVNGEGEGGGFRFSGAETLISTNGGGGVFALNSGGVLLEDGRIEETAEVMLPQEEITSEPWADCVQVNNVDESVALRVTLRDIEVDTDNEAGNGRVGVLLSGLRGENGKIEVQGLRISGSQGNGLITQSGIEREESWTVSYSNSGMEASDLAFEDVLETASALVGRPASGPLRTGGLIGEDGLVAEDGLIDGEKGLIGENGRIGGVEY